MIYIIDVVNNKHACTTWVNVRTLRASMVKKITTYTHGSQKLSETTLCPYIFSAPLWENSHLMHRWAQRFTEAFTFGSQFPDEYHPPL
jgi:hypothetical protein